MKTFPLSAFLSLVTGRSWGEFHEMHGLAEHVMGHPIWTHEFASEKLWTEMRARVLAAHPTLAGVGCREARRTPRYAGGPHQAHDEPRRHGRRDGQRGQGDDVRPIWRLRCVSTRR